MRVILLLALASAPYVFFETFSGLQEFDDEGALMIAFRDIIDGRVLYDEIYALYGPFYYMVVTPLFDVFQVPLTHDSARIICAIFRLCTSAALASFTYRITGSKLASAFSMLMAVVLLKTYVSSALHPQEISFLLIAGLLHLVASLERSPRPLWLVLVGVSVGALLLTKVNLGIFVALPIALAALCISGNNTALRLGHAALLGAIGLIPVALMAPLFQFSWVVSYCAFSVATTIAALLVWSRATFQQILSISQWRYFVLGTVATAVVTIGVTLAGGTTAFQLIDAVVLQSAAIAPNWNLPMSIGGVGATASAVSLGFAAFYAFGARHRKLGRIVPHVIFYLKMEIASVAMAIVVSLFLATWLPLAKFAFWIILPFAWLFAVPPANDEKSNGLTRSVLAVLSAFMVLYAYPVAGGQIMLAALLPTVMLPILIHDVIKDFHLYWRPGQSVIPARVCRAVRRERVPGFLYGVLAVLLFVQTSAAVLRYRSMKPLALAGATFVRANAEMVDNYQWAAAKLSKCENFYTLPGLPSLYFWTGRKPPTGLNINNTLGLLSEDRQLRVIADLENYQGLCVLVYPKLQQFFDRGQIAARPPIVRYIDEHFVEVDSKGPFRLLRRLSVN